MTPVADGRFEIDLDGAKVYDRKERREDDFLPKLQVNRKVALQIKDLPEEKVAS